MSFPDTTIRKLGDIEDYRWDKLVQGTDGIIRDPAEKIYDRYLWFEVYGRGDFAWGLHCNPQKFKDRLIVPERYLEIGPRLASCSCKELDKSAPVVKADKNIERPFERLLVTFFKSWESQNHALGLAGVSLRQLDMLKKPGEIASIAKKMVQGFENMGTLDLFRNSMPGLKDIISKVTEYNKLSAKERDDLDTKCVLYITVYHGEDEVFPYNFTAHCFWKMSTEGTKYVEGQRQKIESTLPSRYSVNHYEYMKNFLKEPNRKWAIYPIAKMEKPNPSEGPAWHTWAEQAIIALYDAYHPSMRDMSWEGLNNPATCLPGHVASILTRIAGSITASRAFSSFARPNFTVRFDSESGLNWNSSVLELYRIKNGLWTGPEKIRHVLTGPQRDRLGPHIYCWLYKGPPCRVEDNGDPRDPNRLAVTFFTCKVPQGVYTEDATQALRLPLSRNAGGSDWGVREGDYVIPAVEITTGTSSTRHPYSYEDFLRVGPYDTFLEMLKVAYRIEYTNADGNLETRYLTQETTVHLPNGNWAQAMSVLATFANNWQGVPKGVPSPLIDKWQIRLRKVEPVFFTESHNAEIPKKIDQDRPELLPNEEMEKYRDGTCKFKEADWYSTDKANWQKPVVIKSKNIDGVASQAVEAAGHKEKDDNGNVKCKEMGRFVYDPTTALDPEEGI
ncbi:hypothetical protein BDP81DRAFT_447467 [Colletotrichum phormii]|uniref:Uncharacterized protein n=1 Tax=Colletotrichum phormii TaxID=359342 RepID=A0AAJ0EKF6_9PEZI|nr:uncharacterized protein BDP81DRAFT_447467 [Colletotrichum phormii]KAK1639865.1 hypothetical protein BDP81DRAFT_447467 [Colletotrichum phormii]